jgi:catechol-2,3-dioxygenase
LRKRAAKAGFAEVAPHPLADQPGLWLRDPDGTQVQIVVSDKVSSTAHAPIVMPSVQQPGRGAAPNRSKLGKVQPQRLSHVLLFSSDVPRSVRFYAEALGLRLSDNSGDVIAFMHGAHASDHHLLAFATSDSPGLHHSSWVVPGIDDIGLGMQQMDEQGYIDGWGLGRHVIGSNYFRYIRDPWGSFAEYSAGIDFIGADVEWIPTDHPLEDSFYVWGPATPAYFIENHESPARSG